MRIAQQNKNRMVGIDQHAPLYANLLHVGRL